ncbi:MAG: TetR/AcrR family transcriptional regulator [Gammaproteobacteria bacterium]|nr:TetR/AcrR family transcriptional regulator [Gammaproteobacteria bacterium]
MNASQHGDDGRSYHHGDLRKTLLETCCAHIASQGTEGLSLRALAREAGVSPTAPYRHFDSRHALLAALATEGFEELAASMRAVALDDPVQAFFDCALSYIRYAAGNPVKYHLMFGEVIGDFSGHEELTAAAGDCYARLEQVLQVGLDSGDLRPDNLEELCGTVWALVHGLAGLTLAAQAKASSKPIEDIMQVPPLRAQQAVAAAPERAVLRLMEGLVADPSRLHGLKH